MGKSIFDSGGGGEKPVLLWKNPNKNCDSSPFLPQTLTDADLKYPISGFGAIIVLAHYYDGYTTDRSTSLSCILKNSGEKIIATGRDPQNQDYVQFRTASFTDAGITFTDNRYGYAGSNMPVNNGACVPIKIWGVKNPGGVDYSLT